MLRPQAGSTQPGALGEPVPDRAHLQGLQPPPLGSCMPSTEQSGRSPLSHHEPRFDTHHAGKHGPAHGESTQGAGPWSPETRVTHQQVPSPGKQGASGAQSLVSLSPAVSALLSLPAHEVGDLPPPLPTSHQRGLDRGLGKHCTGLSLERGRRNHLGAQPHLRGVGKSTTRGQGGEGGGSPLKPLSGGGCERGELREADIVPEGEETPSVEV